MKIWRVEVNTSRNQYGEPSSHLIHASTSVKTIEKAVREARKAGMYKEYDATSVQLIGDTV